MLLSTSLTSLHLYLKPQQHTVKGKIIEILLQWTKRKPLNYQETSSNCTWDFLHITRWGGGSERDGESNETSNEDSFSLLWSINWADDHLSAGQPSQCLHSSNKHQEKLQRVFQTPQKIKTIVEASMRSLWPFTKTLAVLPGFPPLCTNTLCTPAPCTPASHLLPPGFPAASLLCF